MLFHSCLTVRSDLPTTCRVDTETVIHSDSDFATVAYLRIKSAALEEKEEILVDPPVPPLLEEKYDALREIVEQSLRSTQHNVSSPPYDLKAAIMHYPATSKEVGPWVVISAVHGDIQRDSPVSVEDEVRQCFRGIEGQSITLSIPDLTLASDSAFNRQA